MSFPQGLISLMLRKGGAVGDDGAIPPNGAGLLGWLRSIHTALTGTVNVAVVSGSTGGGSGDGKILDGAGSGRAAGVNANLEVATHDAEAIAALGTLNGKDFASSAKQDGIITALGTLATQTKLEAVRVLLDSINTKNFATEATLAAAKTDLDSLAGKDFATAAKQDALKTSVDQVYTAVDQVESYLNTLTQKDYATETTLALVKTVLDSIKTSIDTGNTAQATADKQDSLIAKLGDSATPESAIWYQRQLLEQLQPCQSWASFDTGFATGISAPAANQWKLVRLNGTAGAVGADGDAVVPAGYVFAPTKFFFWASAAGITGRLVEKAMLASWNKTGNSLTFGQTAVAGEIDHWTNLDFEILATFGASLATVTVTYEDWDGTQRTTTFDIPANQAVGTRIRVFPNSAGLGFRRIINVTSPVSGGRGNFYGIKEISTVTTTAANTGANNDITKSHPIRNGRVLAFEMTSTATTAVTVRFSATGCFMQLV